MIMKRMTRKLTVQWSSAYGVEVALLGLVGAGNHPYVDFPGP